MGNIAMIAAGGALGALLRYAVSGALQRSSAFMLPLGTIAVNLTGSLLIGLLWGLMEETTVSAGLKGFIFIGMLGAFTTFSAFALENLHLLRASQYSLVFVNIAVSNIAGIALAFAGYKAGRLI